MGNCLKNVLKPINIPNEDTSSPISLKTIESTIDPINNQTNTINEKSSNNNSGKKKENKSSQTQSFFYSNPMAGGITPNGPAQEEFTKLVKNNECLKNSLISIKNDYKELETKYELKKEEYGKTKEAFDKMKLNTDKLTKERDKFKEELEEKKKLLKDFENTEKENKKQYKQLLEEKTILQKDFDKTKIEINSLNTQLNDEKAKFSSKEQEIKEMKNKLDELQKKNDELTPITIGLDNIGATCYMNATLQSFSNVPQLTNYFLNKYKSDKKKIMSNEYYIVIKNLWDKENNRKS